MGLNLKGTVSLDGSGFEAGLKKLEGAAGTFSRSLKGLVVEAFGIYGIEQAMRKTVEAAKELVRQSERLGVSVESLQVLKRAAKDAGADLDSLATAFEKIDIAREKALGGGAEGAHLMQRFGQLGINQDDLRSKTAAELFQGPMHDAATKMNPEVLGPILRDILGRGFGPMIPLLTTNFAQLREEMEKLGLVMKTETALGLKMMEDQFSLISEIIVTTLAPALLAFGKWLLEIIGRKGPLRDVIEGADFTARRLAGEAKLPGLGPYSARERHDAAVAALDLMQQAQKGGKTFDDYLKSRGGELAQERGAFDARIFSDDVSRNFRDELKYLNEMIQPVAEVTREAAKGAAQDMAALEKKVQNFDAELAKRAEDLKNRRRQPNFGDGDFPTHPRVRTTLYSDSLTRVGNFLGGSNNSLSSVAGLVEKQLGVLHLIEHNTRRSPLNETTIFP